MEAYILLLLFILLLPVAIYLVLSDPDKGTSEQHENKAEQHKREQPTRQKFNASSPTIAYMVLGVLLTHVCALTIMVLKKTFLARHVELFCKLLRDKTVCK